MTKANLIELLKDVNDDVEIEVSGKAVTMYYESSDEANWWDIKGLDTSAKEANSSGQVVLILSDSPVME